MHIADPKLGIFGANGIVAAGLPIAVGAATAAQLRADGSVAVAFFGDGAPAQGAFHEALNLAAVWQLPVIFFCENNGYAEFSPASTQHAASLEQRAAGYGIDYVAVDGNDVVATAAAMEDVVLAARAGARSRRRRGGDLPLARPLRRRPAALPVTGGGPRVGGARPAPRARAPASGGRRRRRRDQGARVRRWPTSSTRRSRPPAGSPARRRPRLTDFVVRARPARAEPPPPGEDAPVFRTMDADPRGPRSRARRGRPGVRRRHRRRRGRQRLRAHPGTRRPVR